MQLGILYNKKGVRRVPANKAELDKDFQNVQQYNFKIKKTPTPGTRRRRRERKRNKKILKEYQEEMRVIGEDPNTIYDGGRRGTRKNMRAMTRRHKRVGKRANRKTRAKK